MKTTFRTSIEVGRYRFQIIRNMLAGMLTIAQAENLQRMRDIDILALIRKG